MGEQGIVDDGDDDNDDDDDYFDYGEDREDGGDDEDTSSPLRKILLGSILESLSELRFLAGQFSNVTFFDCSKPNKNQHDVCINYQIVLLTKCTYGFCLKAPFHAKVADMF